MALGTHPAFLASAVRPTIPVPRPKVKDGPVTSQFPINVSVPFIIQAQTQSNWCSPAVATSISRYYTPINNTWTQCMVVNTALNKIICCDLPSHPDCNVGIHLNLTLSVTGNYETTTGVISDEAVMLHLMAGRPVAARVQWANGGTHAVVITGYSLFMQMPRFAIHDPFYGPVSVTTFHFRGGYYQGSGSWIESYLTQAPSP